MINSYLQQNYVNHFKISKVVLVSAEQLNQTQKIFDVSRMFHCRPEGDFIRPTGSLGSIVPGFTGL